MTRNVLFTGGSSGIGREAVLRFARAGDTVWFTYLAGADRAKAVVEQLAGEGIEALAFEFSQGDWDSHERLLAALPGPVDVLVNNAAVGSKTVLEYESGPAHERAAAMLRINSLGPLWLTQRIVPGMLERGYGKVVNVASVGGGIAPFPDFDPADGMSKAALVNMTIALARDLAPAGVMVNMLAPGYFHTMRNPRLRTEAGRRKAGAKIPAGRVGEPRDVGGAALMLCSPAADYITGQVLYVDGGLTVG